MFSARRKVYGMNVYKYVVLPVCKILLRLGDSVVHVVGLELGGDQKLPQMFLLRFVAHCCVFVFTLTKQLILAR